jgi:hypothetical protein
MNFIVLTVIHLSCHFKSLRQNQRFALQQTKFSNTTFALNVTSVVMIIHFSCGHQSTDDIHILLLKPTKQSEQNPDLIDSFDMLFSWLLKSLPILV